MDTLQIKIHIMNTVAEAPFMENSEDYLETCEVLFEWLSREFEIEDKPDNVAKLQPVN